MNTLQDQQVLILGLGISGLSMARWCIRLGACVTVADTRENPPSLQALRAECPQASFVVSAFDDTLLQRQTWCLIARSPGLPPAQLAQARAWAQAHGAAWVGELDLFAQALRGLAQRERLPYQPHVLAITGTNGKTTVTALTGLLLERAGWRVAVAGNIGPALLDVLGAALDAEAREQELELEQAPEVEEASDVASAEKRGQAETEPVESAAVGDAGLAESEAPVPPPVLRPPPHLPQAWVLELSSFQLDGAAQGAWGDVPTAATVLNLTEDHLDWHGSMAAYVQAKAAVFGGSALMLLNRDDPRVMALEPGWVTVKVGGRNRQQRARPVVRFGLDAPQHAGDWGIEQVHGMGWLVRAQALDETRQRGRSAEAEEALYFQRLMPVDALRIRGRHNAANALAALALACSTGAPLGPMLHGLRDYRGEPHRVSPVAIIDSVEYFDDSKGTNVGATLAAVLGLGAERRLVVILGGDGKGQDFHPLAAALARHARAVVLIGRDAPLIRDQVAQALQVAGVPLLPASDLTAAVTLSAQQAQAGDAVLLSPACASFDMFNSYTHRAQVFIAAVRELALSRGTELEGVL